MITYKTWACSARKKTDTLLLYLIMSCLESQKGEAAIIPFLQQEQGALDSIEILRVQRTRFKPFWVTEQRLLDLE